MISKVVLNAINVSLDSYSILIILFILLSIKPGKTKRRLAVNRWFVFCLIATLFMTLADIFTWLCEGTAHPSFVYILPIAMFVYYATSIAVIVFFTLYIFEYIGGIILSKKYIPYVILNAALYMVLLIITPFTGLYYTIDSNNIYSRGTFFFLSILFEGFSYIMLIIFLIQNYKIIYKKKIIPVITFILFPQLAQIAQILLYGIALVNTGYTFCFLAIFVNLTKSLEKTLDYSVKEVQNKESQLIKMQDHTIISLSSLVEDRDSDTGGHVLRTSNYVELLASQLLRDNIYSNVIDDKFVAYLEKAAPMHDVGKIVVPDAVLKKPGRLNDEEFELMKRHAIEGGKIIHDVLDEFEDHEYIQITSDVAMYHHEKWDGTGYPMGLKGENIPVAARIMAIADVFDALVSERVYKAAFDYDTAFKIIEKEAGTHFDPIIAKEFIAIKDKVINLTEQYKKFDKEENLEELEEV